MERHLASLLCRWFVMDRKKNEERERVRFFSTQRLVLRFDSYFSQHFMRNSKAKKSLLFIYFPFFISLAIFVTRQFVREQLFALATRGSPLLPSKIFANESDTHLEFLTLYFRLLLWLYGLFCACATRNYSIIKILLLRKRGVKITVRRWISTPFLPDKRACRPCLHSWIALGCETISVLNRIREISSLFPRR